MTIKTQEGLTITLTPKMVNQIVTDALKEPAVYRLPTGKPKDWDEARRMANPVWYISSRGIIESCDIVNAVTANHVPTKEHAQSMLAFARLSVIAAALNGGDWTADWHNFNQVKFCITIKGNYPNQGNATSFNTPQATRVTEWNPIAFRTEEDAQYCLEHFKDLWLQYFMRKL